jgi:hypothetical protein
MNFTMFENSPTLGAISFDYDEYASAQDEAARRE